VGEYWFNIKNGGKCKKYAKKFGRTKKTPYLYLRTVIECRGKLKF
jgi:hypothetical protein